MLAAGEGRTGAWGRQGLRSLGRHGGSGKEVDGRAGAGLSPPPSTDSGGGEGDEERAARPTPASPAPPRAQQACRCQCEGPARHWLCPSSAAERLPPLPAPPPRTPAWAAGPPCQAPAPAKPTAAHLSLWPLPPGFPARRVLSTPLAPPLPSEQLHLNSFLNVSSARSSTLGTPQLFWTGPERVHC